MQDFISYLHEIRDKIYDFDLLISGLHDLDRMVEMNSVKQSIVDQIKFLLVNKDMDGHMLHTVLSGDPGVGKTQTGKILAKIWTALGLLKGAKTKESNESIEKSEIICRLQKNIRNIKSDLKNFSPEINLSNYHLKTMKRELEKRPEILFRSFVDKINEILRINSVVGNVTENISKTTTIDELILTRPKRSASSPLLSTPLLSTSLSSTPNHDMDDLIKVVSREDFVGGYLGQSAIKTDALLKKCIGKVLFIDEAYSLVHDEKDSYGKEALTCLNRFMSERPNEIVVIFAGYKDLMDKTIFRFQPGLKRRCSWYFEIDGYSEIGLSEIFTKQLENNNWKLSSDLDIVEFFKENKGNFPAYGGDTLRLGFYCKIVYSSLVFDHKREDDRTIDRQILTKALEKFKTNKIDTVKNDDYRTMFT